MPQLPTRGIIVAHTHWDREWYEPFQVFRRRLVRCVDRALDLLDHHPRFAQFTLDGQTVVLEDYLEVRPEAATRIRRHVSTGRLPIGPWYVLPDEFLVSPEALIRNLQMGARVAAPFGPTMPVGYVADPFGHIAQLPQILRGFGLESFMFTRGLGDEADRLGSEFRWRAPDGSEVLAVRQIGYGGYGNLANWGFPFRDAKYDDQRPDIDLAEVHLRELRQIIARFASSPMMLLCNGTDHTLPQPELPDLVEAMRARIPDLELVQGTFAEYVAAVRPLWDRLQVHEGELRGARYHFLLSSVFSARMPLKLANFAAERLLERWAEPLAALAWWERGAEYPEGFLRVAWRHLLHNHPHDSICGCSIDQVHREMWPRFDQVQQIGGLLASEALAALIPLATPSPGERYLLTAVNPLGQVRDGLVEFEVDWSVPLPPEAGGAAEPPAVLVRDVEEGVAVPCQVVGAAAVQPGGQESGGRWALRTRLAAALPGVPGVGYRQFVVEQGVASLPADLEAGPRQLANRHLRLVVEADGRATLTHLSSGRVYRGLHEFADGGDAGDEYTWCPPQRDRLYGWAEPPAVDLVEAGPARATLSLRGHLRLPVGLSPDRRTRHQSEHVDCPCEVRFSLWATAPWIEVATTFENRARDHRLRVLVPTRLAADEVVVDGHFAVLRRPLRLPAGEGWAERPSPTNHQRAFVAVEDVAGGLAVLNRGLPEYEAVATEDGVVLALTLLRCVGWLSRDDLPNRPAHAGPGLETPEAQCLGVHRLEYALLPYAGDWLSADLHRLARAYTVPARTVVSPGAPAVGAPPRAPWLSVDGEAVELSALKRWERGEALVLRLVNPTPRPSSAQIRFARPPVEVRLATLSEEPGERLPRQGDGAWRLEVAPYRAVTLLATPGPR